MQIKPASKSKQNKHITVLSSLNDYVVDVLGDVIRAGGEVVEDDHFAERLAACKACDYYGKVQPLPLVKAKGCTLCGCPSKTKCRTKSHIDVDTLKRVITTCTAKGKFGTDYWKEIEEKYNAQKA